MESGGLAGGWLKSEGMGLSAVPAPAETTLLKGRREPCGRGTASKTLHNSVLHFIKGSFITFCRKTRQNSQPFQQPETSLAGKAPEREQPCWHSTAPDRRRRCLENPVCVRARMPGTAGAPWTVFQGFQSQRWICLPGSELNRQLRNSCDV